MKRSVPFNSKASKAKKSKKGLVLYRPMPVTLVKPSSEKKYYDIAATGFSVNTSGAFILLYVPTLGTDFNNRIGRKTQIKSLYIRGRMVLENAVALTTLNTAASQARLIIFVDKQPNGATPGITDLLSSADVSSHLNPNNRDRFYVIKDKMFEFDPMIVNTTTGTLGCNRTIHKVKYYRDLMLETIFNSTNGGTIADITSGALYMFTIGTLTAGTNDINMFYSSRVRYVDS